MDFSVGRNAACERPPDNLRVPVKLVTFSEADVDPDTTRFVSPRVFEPTLANRPWIGRGGMRSGIDRDHGQMKDDGCGVKLSKFW